MRIVSGRLVRVTKPEIGAELGIAVPLTNNLRKLPLTAAAITQHTETSVQFTLRKINWLVEQCSREGRSPSRWGFIHEIHLAKIVQVPEIVGYHIVQVVGYHIVQHQPLTSPQCAVVDC